MESLCHLGNYEQIIKFKYSVIIKNSGEDGQIYPPPLPPP